MNPLLETILLVLFITISISFLGFYYWKKLTRKGACGSCHPQTPHCEGCDQKKLGTDTNYPY